MEGGINLKSVAALLCAAAVMATASPALASYSDVPSTHWAAAAVRYVAEDRDWMATGTGAFRPDDALLRRDWARALVRAFAPDEPADATEFYDVTPDDPDFTFVSVAVKHGWLGAPNGVFRPDSGVSKRVMDGSLVLALGLTQELAGLNAISATGGVRLAHPGDFAANILATELRFHHNYPTSNEAPEMLPASVAHRADGAFALSRAVPAQSDTATLNALQAYRTISVGALAGARRGVVEYAFSYVGYPYVWGGEWFRRTPDGYCCGAQPQGGFDCSGWEWWLLRAASGGWDNSAFRPYAGWTLAERTAASMAKAAPTRIGINSVAPLDLLFFDTDSSTADGTDWSSIDHTGIALGNGWMIHSSSSRAGISIARMNDAWWSAHFRWARRIVA